MIATFVYLYDIGKFFVPVAQLDRALASGAEGCRFESCRGYYVLAENPVSRPFSFSAFCVESVFHPYNLLDIVIGQQGLFPDR